MLTALFALFFLPVHVSTINNDCNAYNELEKNTPCGSTGYAMQYGLPNCQNFIAKDGLFDAVGKSFLSCTRSCLANFIRTQIIEMGVRDCSTINDKAFTSHVQCYINCGFCKAAKTNTIALARTFRLQDFFSVTALQQVSSVASACVSQYSNIPVGY